MNGCLDPEAVAAYVDRRLESPDRARAEQHIDSCAPCRRWVAHVASFFAAPTPSADEERVGRYALGREIGRGAMGRVHAAYDPELDRNVAVKLVFSARDDLDRRVLAEARAMARLDHENVVGILDVGLAQDCVYLVMDLIDGDTLGRWQTRRRPWQDVVDAYRQAARGLAAAHAAGLVHRDFKPANALIDRRGTVRVTDFGLARDLGLAQAPVGVTAQAQLSSAPASPSSTSAVLVGTPAYMAPEQLRGEAATAASDQFAWCVSLWEALSGERPFDALALHERADQIGGGPGNALPREVPSRVRLAVLRGLRPDPSDRFASLDALLGALAPARLGRRVGWVLAAVGVATLALPLASPPSTQANRLSHALAPPLHRASAQMQLDLARQPDVLGDRAAWTSALEDAYRRAVAADEPGLQVEAATELARAAVHTTAQLDSAESWLSLAEAAARLPEDFSATESVRALLSEKRGDPDQAWQHLESALAWISDVPGGVDIEVGLLNQLAPLAGDRETSIALAERSLELSELHFGFESAQAAIAAASLAGVILAERDVPEPRAMGLLDWAIWLSDRPPLDPVSVHNVAGAYALRARTNLERGNRELGRRDLERCQTLGADPTSDFAMYCRLLAGQSLILDERWEDAIGVLSPFVDDALRTAGPDDASFVAMGLNLLARGHAEVGRDAEAIRELERAIEIWRRYPGVPAIEHSLERASKRLAELRARTTN